MVVARVGLQFINALYYTSTFVSTTQKIHVHVHDTTDGNLRLCVSGRHFICR